MDVIPSELVLLIISNVHIGDFSSLYRVNKMFHKQLSSSYFWCLYFNKYSINEAYDFLHDLIIQFAKNGDIILLSYLLLEKIKVKEYIILKEPRTILRAYIEAFNAEKRKTRKFLWSKYYEDIKNILPSQFNRVRVNEVNIMQNCTYVSDKKLFNLKLKLIKATKNADVEKWNYLFSKYESLFGYITEELIYILAYSNNYNFISDLNRIWDSLYLNLKHESPTYHDIVDIAMTYGNIKLVQRYSKRFIGFNYGNYLRSSRPDAEKLAFGPKRKTSPNKAREIDYIFGNKDILLKYIKNNPKDTIVCLLNSYKVFTINEFIKVFPWDIPLSQTSYDDFLKELNKEGYTYLKRYFKENAKVNIIILPLIYL